MNCQDYKNKHIRNAVLALQRYYAGTKEAAAEMQRISKQYKGEQLQNLSGELSSAVQSLHEAAKKEVESCLERLEAVKQDALAKTLQNAEISKDFKLLELPLTLKENELEQLAGRNKDNALFIRALNEYAVNHNMPIRFESTAPDYDRAYNAVKSVLGGSVCKSGKFLDCVEDASNKEWELDMLAGELEKADAVFGD